MSERWRTARFAFICSLFSILHTDGAVLTFEQWLNEAVPAYPGLKIAEAHRAGSVLIADERIVWENPELRVGVDARPGTGDQTTITLRFPVPHFVEERAEAASSRAALKLADAEQQMALRTAREDLGLLYLEALAARSLAEAANGWQRGAEDILERAEAMRDRGVLTQAEWLRLRVEAADAIVNRAEHATTAEVMVERLREYLPGLPPHAEIELQPASLAWNGAPPSRRDLRVAIDAGDPELAMRIAAMQVASAEIAAERAERIPFPTFVEGSWRRDEGGNGARDEWEGRIGISLPLFSWSRGVDPRERADALVAQAGMEERREEITRLAERVHHRYVIAEARLETIQETLEPLLATVEETLATPPAELELRDRLRLVEDRYRLRRDLIEAELEVQTAAWALHTLAWNWQGASSL